MPETDEPPVRWRRTVVVVTVDGSIARENVAATGAAGLIPVAPFAGEHGWYWLNIHDGPVTITLTVTGFYDDIVDYGIF